MKIFQNLIIVLHLNKRWIRWMLSLSLFVVFSIAIFPGMKTSSDTINQTNIKTEIIDNNFTERLSNADTIHQPLIQPIIPIILEAKKPIEKFR